MDLLQSCNYCSTDDSISSSRSKDTGKDSDIDKRTERLNRIHSNVTAERNQNEKNLRIPSAINPIINHTTISSKTSCIESIQEQQQKLPQYKRRKKRRKLCFSRSVPHIRGNWCGHIFLDIDSKSSIAAKLLYKAAHFKIKRFHEFLSQQIESLAMSTETNLKNFQIISHLSNKDYDSDITSDSSNSSGSVVHSDPNYAKTSKTNNDSFKLNLHISLSRPFYLQEQSIQPFVRSLKKRLSFEQSLQCSFSLKDINKSIHPQDILVNDDKSRSFLVLSSPPKYQHQSSKGKSNSTHADFKRIISCVDHVMKMYNQPLYYEDPKMHVSIASVKGDATSLFQKNLETKFEQKITPLNKSRHENKTHTPLNFEKKYDDDDDNDDIDIPDILTLRFERIFCTFGTTKKFEINLQR